MIYSRLKVCPLCKGRGTIVYKMTEEEYVQHLLSQMSQKDLQALLERLKEIVEE